ncbi:hypothetical protein DFJ58DRAFT_662785 [Suillus subalutaceus]|uniref:uncharacterized protein n=1 Tax=Suillus subalutaceus TaxID=48586 RepID=UPI001B88009E|nr:uncharacterized protein DFJ58DRAFT_662785 [Suillus subalutaceus]KAG1848707.1 hypothetical protein DFJ58DRAFT_662785 [Suillus subalutaceus]
MFQEDPNLAIRPDYTLEEHQAACQHLVDEGLTDDQAAWSLAALWTLTNNGDKERWNLRQEHIQQMKAREAKEAEELQQAVRRDDRKKNKTKYAPLVHRKVPSDPTILPAQYTTRKLKAGDYCEPHYFTNRGLEDVKSASLIAEPDAMVMLPSADSLHSWIPAVAVKDPKAVLVIKDECLSWEEFNNAAPHMLASMRLHDWLKE